MTTKTTTRVGLAGIGILALLAGPARAEDEAPAPAPASQPAAPGQNRSTVHHVPPAEAPAGQPLRLAAAVENAWLETALVARYRRAASRDAYVEVPFERSSAGGYYAVIPSDAVGRPGVEYFVVGVLPGGGEVDHFASSQLPHEVRVEPDAQLRWIEAERRRLHGRVSRVNADVQVVNFGTDFDADYFIRGQVDWTHRLVTTLYSFTLGYGFIEGYTPGERASDPPTLEHDVRYGFGEIRVRAHRAVWLDAGVMLGFSHEGFSAGVRGQLVLGQDWRSCVMLGFEYIGDLGDSYWVKLQWDTAAPFLMSATVKATNLPGAELDGGAEIDYDVSYPLTERISLGATLTYASRERRPGAAAGGLFSSVEF